MKIHAIAGRTGCNRMSEEIRDCHYCGWAFCESKDSDVNCYAEDDTYYDNHVKDSKEAEQCEMFDYNDTFPKW